MVFSVLRLICAGMKARMKLGTLRQFSIPRGTKGAMGLRADVERPENCRHVGVGVGTRRRRSGESDALEFHAGPKGKSQAKMSRMNGDAAPSTSSLSAPSAWTASQS
jgi:hypothetical protein